MNDDVMTGAEAMVVRPDLFVVDVHLTARAPTMAAARALLQRWLAGVVSTLPSGCTVTPQSFAVVIDEDEGGAPPPSAEQRLSKLQLDLSASLDEAKKRVAIAIADEKRLERQLEAERELSVGWEQKATLALKADNEALAAQARSRKREHEELAAGYEKVLTEQKQSVDELKAALTVLHGKIEEAKRRRNMVMAKAARAKAEQTIASALDEVAAGSALLDAFDRREAAFRLQRALRVTIAGAEQILTHAQAAADAAARTARRAFLSARARAGHSARDDASVAPVAAAAVPSASSAVARVVAVAVLPLAADDAFWQRAESVSAFVDALRAATPAPGATSNAAADVVDVACAQPRFRVGDTDRYRPHLRARLAATHDPALGDGPIDQRSLDSEHVELRLSDLDTPAARTDG